MDESIVKQHAEAHGQAIVDGDINRAGSDLTKDAMASAGPVMKAMPQPVTAAEVQSVTAEGDAFVATIRYRGAEDQELVVKSRWVDEGGRPKIAGLALD